MKKINQAILISLLISAVLIVIFWVFDMLGLGLILGLGYQCMFADNLQRYIEK